MRAELKRVLVGVLLIIAALAQDAARSGSDETTIVRLGPPYIWSTEPLGHRRPGRKLDDQQQVCPQPLEDIFASTTECATWGSWELKVILAISNDERHVPVRRQDVNEILPTRGPEKDLSVV